MTENKASNVPSTRHRSAPYPRYTLEQVEKFALMAFQEGPRNCDQDIVAKKAGYSSANNGAFLAIRSAANQFGLIVSKGDRISVAEEWIKAFHKDTQDALSAARLEAIKAPSLYRRLLEEFSDNQLPPLDKLTRTIYFEPKYGITKDAAPEAAKIFIESAQYAGVLDEKKYLRMPVSDSVLMSGNSPHNPSHEDQSMTFSDTRTDNRTNVVMNVPKSMSHQQVIHSESNGNVLSIPVGMEKQEFTFRGGKKAYFILPVPLPVGEKTRLKQWLDLLKLHIDLTLEEEPELISQSAMDTNKV